MKKNVLLICGGGGSEHDISLISAKFLMSKIEHFSPIKTFYVEIQKDGNRVNQNGHFVELRKGGLLFDHQEQKEYQLHFAIPCIHGPPGESGDIQSLFEMMKLPYFGCGPEASILCFNKISTKLWLDAFQIPNAPFLILDKPDLDNHKKAISFFKKHKSLYVKASSQGSSIGCFFIEKNNEAQLEESISEAFKLSPYVLLEKNIVGRELEIAVYQDHHQIRATDPGEIICPDNKFYTFDQKYSKTSQAITHIKAKNLSKETKDKMKSDAIKAFKVLKLRHLARIDFFLSEDNHIYLNEINTFPGLTPISMFPKMIEDNNLQFENFIQNIILENIHL